MKINPFSRLAAAGMTTLLLPMSGHALDCPEGVPLCAPLAVVNAIVPNLLSTVAPGDAPLVLRTTTLTTAAWFDAIAPYNDTAVGVHSELGRLTGDDSERNIAILYASHEVLNSLMPQFADHWDMMLSDLGLDPSDDSTDTNTAVGVGNAAGAAVVAAREQDGMNQLGGDCSSYSQQPYADCSGYRPRNNAERLINPRRWQPDTLTTGSGVFFSQQFVTPQLADTRPFSYDEPTLMAPVPHNSFAVTRGGHPLPGYRAQANEVLAAQAVLTDEQKLLAEFYDNKINSLGFSTLAAGIHHELSLEQFVQLDYLVNVAAFDTAITIWHNKRHYDAVRPFSAIAYMYRNTALTAWGGPGKGTVNDITGSDWRPYLPSANHPEYPSASASFCRAHATATKLYLEDVMGLDAAAANDLSFWVPGFLGPEPQFEALHKPAGSSFVEPGVTPQTDTALGWATWDEFSDDCGISRLWAGVHFYDSIPAGQAIGDPIGAGAYEWLKAHIDGNPQ